VDALLMPACPVLPPPLDVDEVVALNGRLEPLFPTVTRNTGPGSTAGVPMLTLPAGSAASGLPVGMTLEGGFFGDARLLALGAAVEGLLRP
jgi:mandelamide amidase